MATAAPRVRGPPPRPGAAPASNRNAYAGANIGVPWSPLEGVTSLDPNDYVWAAAPPVAGCGAQPAMQAMWHHLGAMAMLQGAACGWPLGLSPGLPLPGVAGMRGMTPACMPGFPVQAPGQWNSMQQVAPVDGQGQGRPAGTAAQRATTLQASGQAAAKTSKATTSGNSAECQKAKKSMEKQKSGKAEALPRVRGDSVNQCSEDFLDCVMDLNEEDLQQLLQEPLDTFAEAKARLKSLDGAHGQLVSETSDASAFSLHNAPSCGSQLSETLPDHSMLFLEELDLTCLKEANSFPDLTKLECLEFAADCAETKEGCGKASKAPGQLRKRKGGVSKKRGQKERPAVPMFVDDECLKELEQMLGTGVSAEAFNGKPKGAGPAPVNTDVAKNAANEKNKGIKNVRKGGGRKTPKTH